MTKEELQSALWEIVRVVATESSSCYCDAYGNSECPFCSSNPEVNQIDNVKHEDKCIVIKARKLIEKGILADL